ncbi:3-phosphoshikimate 1-carboxyvinyltransferase [candidate division KSB1 bacterium]|nr:3-phosphoshikimate 1-carboxyvinyltransferase [candidate division KSB1 bacterium]RQW03810.1 MAG: 3-phosphoshikimate 1-carboxyvinyltransferase [candidate division KSB1 bacterium]
MSDKKLHPVQSLQGTVRVPGDKSISHRALIVSAIADGACRVSGLSTALDVQSTAACLKALGVKINKAKDGVIVHGVGMHGLQPPRKALDAGNSGTTIRLLAGMLAAQNFTATITGDRSLRNRPMRRIIEPLELMGARIDSDDFKAPLTITGGPLRAIDFASPVASAQVKSCILLAGLFARGVTRVTEPYHSRDHTELMLQEMGANIHSSEALAAVIGPSELHARDIDVPGDISAAAFFLVAGALLPNSTLVMENIGVNLLRTGILTALTSMGVNYQINDQVELNREPRATIAVKSATFRATTLGGAMIPRIVDEIPILAIAATQAEGVTTIKDARELRVKESDRLAALAANLTKMGAKVREKEDGLIISGPTTLHGAELDSYNDHRIAMAFSIAALIADGETTIKNVDCVDISFPGFYDILESIIHDER